MTRQIHSKIINHRGAIWIAYSLIGLVIVFGSLTISEWTKHIPKVHCVTQ